MIKIEVVFATYSLQKIVALEVELPCSIADAIARSQIQDFFPDYDLLSLPVGIFGKRQFNPEQYQLKHGDRIEIYRPLNKTPNQKRLERARK
ncbi:MAG: RnfH family protein [Burkholderiales bacterium]|nr:RnfH family protein [Burkholderiales bacterium]